MHQSTSLTPIAAQLLELFKTRKVAEPEWTILDLNEQNPPADVQAFLDAMNQTGGISLEDLADDLVFFAFVVPGILPGSQRRMRFFQASDFSEADNGLLKVIFSGSYLEYLAEQESSDEPGQQS